MKISVLLQQKNPIFSFEFFPPKTAQGVERLFETIANLKSLSPSFVSVTYGPGQTIYSNVWSLHSSRAIVGVGIGERGRSSGL